MRFHKMFETQGSGTKRCLGMITGISQLNVKRWKKSQWRNLQVVWDEGTAGERRNRVSVWDIELVVTPFSILPTPFFYQSNEPTQWMLGDKSADLDNIYKRTMPWLSEDVSMKDPGLSLVQWMNMQPNNQIQLNLFNPLSALQNYAGPPDLSLQLGLSAPQMLTQNNLQFNNQRTTLQVEHMPAMMQP